MENLADVGTRVVMLVSEGLLTTIMIVFFDWRIALAVITGIAIFLMVNSTMQKKSAQVSMEKLDSDTSVVEKILEYIQGISEVKSYHLSGKLNTRLDSALDANAEINTKMELKLIPWIFAQNLVCKLIGTVVCLLSLYFYTNHTMSLLNCILMMICAFMLKEGLEKAGRYSALLRSVDICVSRANEILQIEEMDTAGKDLVRPIFL